ncbi:S26 family signal peptidase [Streptomyces flavofungini]|uniref:S26 family signal peptidase n=1 Tax=Streptomyces flavofungini TaxID=68200 RepID=UPI0034DE7080
MRWTAIVVLSLAAGLVWRIRRTNLRVTVVGSSMEPGLPHGTQVFTKRVPPQQLASGDIVVLPEPGSGQLIIKRIAAVGGEPAPEPMDGDPRVPRDMVVLLGDNPSHSHDSRHFGYVPARHIRGRVVRVA